MAQILKLFHQHSHPFQQLQLNESDPCRVKDQAIGNDEQM